MKFNFKRIASIITGAVMLSSTVALAAAAANQFPDPFVQSGSSNYAVVYGSNVNVAQTDINSALNIVNKLNTYVTASAVTGTGTTTVTGEGDQYLMEKTSTKFHIGNGVLDVVSASVTDDNLPTLLAAGKYRNSDNDEYDYTQKLTLANFSVTMFNNNNYKADTPTVGIYIPSGSPVLNYSLEMSSNPNMSKLETTELPILGKKYYVLDVSGVTKITLLDSAENVLLKEGETKTVTVNGKPYELSISFIGSTSVKLKVNDEVTNSLAEAQTYKLTDGSYVGIKDIAVQDYAGGTKQVEFGIGSGKLILNNAQNVEINDVVKTGLKSYITPVSGDLLSKVTIEWKADKDRFVANDTELVMPAFNAIKLLYAGENYPKTEAINVEKGGDDYIVLKDFPLKEGPESINLLYTSNNINYTGTGKKTTQLLRTPSEIGGQNITFVDNTDDYFVLSWSDGKDAESYLVRPTNFVTATDGSNKTDFEYAVGNGDWKNEKKAKKAGDTITLGSAEFTIERTDVNAATIVLTTTGNSNFNTLYSKEDMRIVLPWVNNTVVSIVNKTQYDTLSAACAAAASLLDQTAMEGGQLGSSQAVTYNTTLTADNLTTSTCTYFPNTYKLAFAEKDKNGDVAAGKFFNLTLGLNDASTKQVSVTAITGNSVTAEEIGDTKVYRSFEYSDLATEFLWDKSGDQYGMKLINHGGETTVKTYLAAPTISSSGTSSNVTIDTGLLQIKDSEVATKGANKNLVVVGGSCINTVAATLLGSATPLCGADFTNAAKTKVGREVGAGSYLISTFASPYSTGKVAMLVAGYDAQDTVNAATYLTTQTANVSTAVNDTFVNGVKVTVSGQ